jgi:23S rRNA (adenine-N6)-dimethyltransferase
VAARLRPARGAPGQHFVRSSRLASELVREAGVTPADLVVEVGAGSGVLTRALARAGARVLALELDPELASQLRARFAGSQVSVLEADALRYEWPREPFAVVANVPFAGSSELVSRLLRDPSVRLRRADLIVQWELAAKHAAIWPATMRGVYWRAWFELSIVTRLSRHAFSPVPSVDAAVLRITRRPSPLVPVADHDAYRSFLAEAFRERGQVVRGVRSFLTPRQVRRVSDVLGFAPDAAARDLDVRHWAALFALASRTQGAARRGAGRLRSQSRDRERSRG